MRPAVARLMSQGVAESTRRSYRVGWDRYRSWAGDKKNLLPVSEESLCMFVASLEQEGLSSSTVKGYLAAIRFIQISEGWPDPQWS